MAFICFLDLALPLFQIWAETLPLHGVMISLDHLGADQYLEDR